MVLWLRHDKSYGRIRSVLEKKNQIHLSYILRVVKMDMEMKG